MTQSRSIERTGPLLEFGVLGPVQILLDGRPAPLGGSGVRSLLALLVLDANQVVAFDQIVDALWGEDPPDTARTIVHGYVSKLRRILGTAGGPASILTRPPGYLLQVEPDQVDLHRARTLIAQASGRPAAERAELLRAALRLWRGPVLVDAPLATGLPDLDELRLVAVEERVCADLELGKHAEVVGELRRLVEEHPSRERLLSLLMLAQYRSARRIDALVSYRRFQRYASEELGVDPGPELRQLHEQVLRDDPALRLPGTGAHRPLSYGTVIPAQLPPASSSFAGRDVELSWMDGLLHAGPGGEGAITLAGLIGPPGIGKSALALTWSHRTAGAFPDGQLFAALRGFDSAQPPTSPAEVLTQFLLALGVPAEAIPLDTDERAALYRSVLAERRVLVLLDDARDSEQVRPLLPAGTGSLVLVTSRRRLDGLVARGGARLLTLDTLSSEAAIRLLDTSGGHQRRGEEIEALRTLARLCGQLPLALRIAAARLAASPQWTVQDLVAELADEQHRLRALDLEDADTSVRGAFDVSYRALHPDLAETFRVLGVHQGPTVTPYLVAALCRTDLVTARRRLRELAGAHLITETRADRFVIHDLLRLHARELAETELTAEQRAELGNRLLDHYLVVADHAHRLIRPPRDSYRPDLPADPGETPVIATADQALRWFDAEWPGLVAAVRFGAAKGLHRRAWQLALCLRSYLYLRGLAADWADLFRLGLASAQAVGDRAGEALMLRGLGNAAELVGGYTEALRNYERAHQIARELGELALQATAEDNLGGIHTELRRYEQAHTHLGRALALYRTLGDQQGEAVALNNLGVLDQDQGRYDSAFDNYQRALGLHRAGGNDEDAARALANLCWVSRQLKRYDEAEGYAREGLRLAQKHGMAYVEAMLHHQLGELYLDQGRKQPARFELGLALDVYRRMRSPYAADTEQLLARLAV